MLAVTVVLPRGSFSSVSNDPVVDLDLVHENDFSCRGGSRHETRFGNGGHLNFPKRPCDLVHQPKAAWSVAITQIFPVDGQFRRVRRNRRRLQRMGLTVERLTRRVESREHNSSFSDGVSRLKSGLGERIRLRNLLPLTELMKSARSVLRSRVFHYSIDKPSML
jgi:hypothetical protein